MSQAGVVTFNIVGFGKINKISVKELNYFDI